MYNYCTTLPLNPFTVVILIIRASGVWMSNIYQLTSGVTRRGGLHHEWEFAAPEEEQKEVEAAVVPPQRQGALHLHSPWGEGAQSLPHQPQNLHTLLAEEEYSHCIYPPLFQVHDKYLTTHPLFPLFPLSHKGILCALALSLCFCWQVWALRCFVPLKAWTIY